jgi:hypothetical protein
MRKEQTNKGSAPEGDDGKIHWSRLTEGEKKALGVTYGAASATAAIAATVSLFAHGLVKVLVLTAGILLIISAVVIGYIRTRTLKVRMPLLLLIAAIVATAAISGGIAYSIRAGVHSAAGPALSHPALSHPALSHPASRRVTTPVPSLTSPAPTTPAPTSPASPAAPAVPAGPAVRHQGILVLQGDGLTSYDLDSTASDWGAATGTWVSQNIQYFPDQENNGQPTLNLADEPQHDVLLGKGGNWTYTDCAHANYIQSFDANVNPNYLIGSAIAPGSGICVQTFDNTPYKHDGNHYALLVVLARSDTTLTVRIVVWQ